ncbi:MAG: transglycosylase domain-containing protein [Acidobacteria bacterium]|nr:transglycosylase domain-containing protein [Acidobacteriota bacterium]
MPWRRSVRIAARWTAVLSGLGLAALALFVVYGVSLVDRSMAAELVGSGTRVVSAPLELRAGQPWTVSDLRRTLKERGIPEWAGEGDPRAGEFLVAGDRVVVAGGAASGRPGATVLRATGSGLVIQEPSGRAAAGLTLAPTVIGTTAAGDTVRWPVRLADVSPHLLTAVVDIEDRSFLSHAGLSLRGLLRAAVRDLAAGGVRQGGSTITQQLAKMILLRPARTVSRKVLEAWLAALIEYRYEKRTILEVYLNRIYLGQDGGWQIVGVEAGAKFYFGKRASDLAVEEAALLAGVVAAPNRFDPFAHPAAATARRSDVLAAMVRAGHLGQEEAASLSAAPLPRASRRLRWPPAAQYVEHVLAAGPRTGLVRTALDPAVQAAVWEGCEAALSRLEQRVAGLRALARAGDPLQVAVVAMTPDGRVVAVQGSRLGLPGEFNRALAARRQVGSLVKPFVVATALEDGWSLDDELDDAPISVPVGGKTWSPENSDGTYRGRVSVEDALVLSLNVPIVRLGLAVSVEKVAATLHEIGFAEAGTTPATLLGAFEATPVEVARAYAAVLGGAPPTVAFGEVGQSRAPSALPPAVAAAVRATLEEVPRRGTAAVLAGGLEGRLACKTGTTDQRRDSWFVGVRPQVVVAVWLGTDGNRETGLFGATGALEVWREVDARLPGVWRAGRFPD